MLIQKLEKRFYPRMEIAEIMELSTRDKNFADKVKTRLKNWGYKYIYIKRRGVEITGIPSTAEEKVQELLIRKLNLDSQTNLKAFAIMMNLLASDYEFATSPWLTRENIIWKEYGIEISESAMRNWAKKLAKEDILTKITDSPEIWRSYRDEFDMKHQERVSDDEEKLDEYEKYKAKKSQYLKEADKAYQEENDTLLPSPTRWKETYSKLWHEFNCCYYSVKPFVFNAFYDDDYRELFELTEEIVQNLIIEVADKKETAAAAEKFVF